MIDFVFRNKTRTNAFQEAFFRDLIERTLLAAGISEDCEVSLTLAGLDEMQGLNKQYRSKDKPTDVLSFPLGESPVPGYTGRTLGDIFICPEYAIVKAEEEHISIEEKMAWLTVHGTLHLLDYDHERSESDATDMEQLEKKILNK